MNNTKRLPDAYAKNTDSNIYRLLQLVNLLYNDLQIDLKCIDKSRDIHEATGKTLDRYGEMINVSRGGATDEQYRTKILSQIARYVTESDCNSVISAIAHIFDVPVTDISIVEENMKVDILGLTMEMLEKSGYKSREIETMIRGLIPIGVELSPPKYAGTLKILSDEEIERMDISLRVDYPVLYPAWIHGNMFGDYDRGLSGDYDLPEDWVYMSIVFGLIPETFKGGTLGMLSGEDE